MRVSYDVVRGLVPALWDGKRRIDFCIHIGMAAGREYYSIERRAWKTGYSVGDVDGRLPGIGEDGRRIPAPEQPATGADGKVPSPTRTPASEINVAPAEADEQRWESWEGLPEMLGPAIDVDEVLARWRGVMKGEDVRVSNDAGRYLCEYIYYASLAHLWREKEEARVLFVHVPGWCGEMQWERGVRALVGLAGVVGGLVGGGEGKEGVKGAVKEGVKGGEEVGDEKKVYVGGGAARERE